MGKILGIKIQNYGSLKNIKMGKLVDDQAGEELGDMVAIIGASGNGKSTLADAVGFISDCLSTDVESACDANNRGGYNQLVSQNSDGPIHFEIHYKETSTSHSFTYELTIAKDKNDRPYIQEERLRQSRFGYKRIESFSVLYIANGKGYAFEGIEGGQKEDGSRFGTLITVDLSDTRKLGIVALGAMKQYSRIEEFLRFMESWYLCYFSPDAARQTQTAAPAQHLNRTGSNLNSVARYMYRENPSEFQKILADIQTKIPNITKIEPLKLPTGQMVLEFWQQGFAQPFFSQRMSDGTLKLFAYYLLLHEKNPRQLIFIEEPENGLYHQYLADLALEMKRTVNTTSSKQLFVTTHSPFFVNALSPNQVWVLEKDMDDFTVARRADSYDFVQDLVEEGVYMGDLWYSRYFG